GGDGADVLIGGPGNDTVIGGRGGDVILLGAGDDVAIWDPGDGSDTIEGQDGKNDGLALPASNVGDRIDIALNERRVRLSRDIGAITMDLNGVEQVDVSALGGMDHVTVNDLGGTDVKGVTVDLAGVLGTGDGDGQFDSVVVNGTPDVD